MSILTQRKEGYSEAKRIVWVGSGERVNPDDHITYVGWNTLTQPKTQRAEVHISQWDFLREVEATHLLTGTGVYIPGDFAKAHQDWLNLDKNLKRQRLLEFLSQLANLTGKEVEFYDTYKDWMGLRSFILRTWSGVTLEDRKERMDKLTAQATEVLKAQPHISQIWLGGSFGENNPYAKDVDLLAVVTGTPYKKLWDKFGGITNFQTFFVCNYDGRRDGYYRILDKNSAKQLTEIAEMAGVKLDCLAMKEEVFLNYNCCSIHRNIATEFPRVQHYRV